MQLKQSKAKQSKPNQTKLNSNCAIAFTLGLIPLGKV